MVPRPGDPLPALVQEVGCPWPVTQALLLPTAGTDPADDFPSPSSALYADCCRRRASRTAQALHTARHPNVGSRAASPPGISLISDVPFPPPGPSLRPMPILSGNATGRPLPTCGRAISRGHPATTRGASILAVRESRTLSVVRHMPGTHSPRGALPLTYPVVADRFT